MITNIPFCCVECHLFEIANLLLKCGTPIHCKNEDSENIIEYLIEKKKLDSDNLLFILNIQKDVSLISVDSLCQLIKLDNYKVLEELFKFKYYDKNIIFNTFLL